ncbi:MAG: cysteine desulfurase DndA, partial [Bacillaceae bacterium]|nr:cysteine desulfurase DndA [Bacillaceae bacterium]
MPLYLDYSATTPVHSKVLEKMIHVYEEEFGNAGSRTHAFGQRANQIVTEARRSLATLLAVDPADIIFTSGATESNNLAILGLARWGADQGKRHIVSTTIEHKAVLEPLVYLQKQGFEVEFVPVNESGRIDAAEVCRR